jgi:DHA2 family methylenomycin A resistance protein-like MFS transporter
MSLMLQQERGLGALACGLMFLPLTALISLGNLCAAPLGQRVGRRATLAGGQAALAGTLLAVAWASTADALWPLAVALVPVGLSAGLLVPTMTSQALDAVSARTHGAAAAVFNSVRQVGGAVGVAGFGPVLAHQSDLRDGFVACAVVAASATAVALALTAAMRRGQPRAPSQSEPPARNASAAADALR